MQLLTTLPMNQVPNIFNRKKVGQRLSLLAEKPADFITDRIVDDLCQRLSNISRPFEKAVLLAPNPKPLSNQFTSALGPIRLERISTLLSTNNQNACDPENLHLPASDYDLIISLFDIGFTNDVPGFLNQIMHHLKKDGLFVAAFIGGQSLNELRAAWLQADDAVLGGALARIAPFIDIKDAGSLLQRAGFALPVADRETLCLRYKSPLHLMKEIKELGASNPLFSPSAKPVTRMHIGEAIKAYEQIAKDPDNRIRATLEIIWMSGWKPDQSQQKPLKPGSAQVSLAQVLGEGKS